MQPLPRPEAKDRFATVGFTDKANLEDGAMWPKEDALRELTPADEAAVNCSNLTPFSADCRGSGLVVL